MLIGEAPGDKESIAGRPFVGPSGEELTRYLRAAGINRADCYITNLCKHQPRRTPHGKQLPPSPEEIAQYVDELELEMQWAEPEIVCTVGAYATRFFLGKVEMPLVHGVPHSLSGRIYVPTFHPAAGLHKSAEQPKIYRDFQRLGEVARGELRPIEPTPFAGTSTELLDAASGPERITAILAGRQAIGCDTEGTIADPECVTICVEAGVRWFIGADQPQTLAALNALLNSGTPYELRCHYIVHDLPVLRAMGVSPGPAVVLRDTMVDSYVLQTEPQGLKPLAYRRLHRTMREYEEVVYEAEQRTVLDYLRRVWEERRCRVCGGTGKIPKLGKTGPMKGLKLKSVARCEHCVDGALMLATDPQLVWKAGEPLRVAKPWSLSRTIRMKLTQLDLIEFEVDEDDDDSADDGATDEQSEAARKTWALRKWWDKRANKTPEALAEIERAFGSIRRTRLADVGDPEGTRKYACDDAEAALLIADDLGAEVAQYGLTRRAEIICRATPMFERMERVGMRIDRPYLKQLQAETETELDRLLRRLQWLTGAARNPQSPKIANLLFREMALAPIKLTKGKSRESVDDKVLETLRVQLQKRTDDAAKFGIEVIECITDYREKNKLLGTYILPLQRKADSNDRVHTQITYTRTTTGRPATRNPNQQNIPIRTPEGKKIRNAFVARPGFKLISCDYSQIELVILAHESQDPTLLEAFRTGRDVHRLGASRMFTKPYDDITSDERASCKNLNFGIPYGVTATGLQEQFALRGIMKTEAECQALIDSWFDAHPGVRVYMQKVYAEARVFGYVRESIGGGIRWCPGAKSELRWVREAAQREAGNYPMQGGAASLLEIAMANIWEGPLPLLWSQGVDIEPLVPVHDELVFECQEDMASAAAPLIANEMKYAAELSLPINVGVNIGDRWGELK